ncbi:MAG: extracellular solute-binding protein [Clostridia bacterium]|nr:extracellular solute-binding protein [Clostridia bacterium]
MKKTKFQRSIAMFLALITVIGCFASTSVFATDTDETSSDVSVDLDVVLNTTEDEKDSDSVSDKTIDDVKEILNALSYEEYSKKYANVPRAKEAIVISAVDYITEKTDAKVYATAEYLDEDGNGVEALYTPGDGTVVWAVDVPETAKYSIVIEYYPVVAKSVPIQRIFRINQKIPFGESRHISLSKVWVNQYEELDPETGRMFKLDIDRNELRPTILQTPEWRAFEIKDGDGFYSESFEFVFEAGRNEISLESVSEPMAMKSISLIPHVDMVSYDDVRKDYDKSGYKPSNKDYFIKMEAEEPVATSSQTIYPVEDFSSAITSPTDPSRTVLNTIGGEKWQSSGQWVRYTFTPQETGLYNIVTRYKQSINDGLYSSRTLYIYGGEYNGIPFSEATQLRFNYSSDWQTDLLNDGMNDFEFYFEAGVEYTIELEVSLGSMGDVVRRVEAALTKINNAYLNVMKLTGTSPDSYRDYGFSRVMPEVLNEFILMSRELYDVSGYLSDVVGVKGSQIATLDRVAWLLEKMGKDENAIAKNLSELKSHIGNLGTWITTAKTQPLQLDYILIQSTDASLPKATEGFFKAFVYEIKKFFMSFFRNYDRIGVQEETTSEDNSVEVWLAYGRDQSQVIRTLVNNEFTPQTGVSVKLKLVAAGTLLPSILAGMGPDVYIGLSQPEVINYAIRGAIMPIEDREGYDEVVEAYNEAALLPLGLEDAEGIRRCYGLPETQTFAMMFYRKDILADLNIDIPKTWDDILAAVPVLQANNMEIGLTHDYKVFLYQQGGELFADGGMRINLDSNVALQSFEKMCNMFTMYSFPYTYDFVNRFRTGEMPIGVASYSDTYNKLVVFATEIGGLWEFAPIPGTIDENGDINNVAVSTVTATVMIDGCDNPEGAWEFMKWYCGESCQIQYSNEMVAILGDSAKHPTANKKALESLPWTTDELASLKLQFNNLASIPNYPGYYIVDRYTNFSFLAAYNNNANPVTELLSYINTINKEITRKRGEFGLETLEIGQTLASKRLGQAKNELEKITAGEYSSQIDAAMNAIEQGVDIEAIRVAADALEAADATLFGTAIGYLREAADALSTY